MLKRFASCINEIKLFLDNKGIQYPELTEDQWLQKLHFMVDITSQLNQLNRKLQGKGNTAFSMLEEIISFEKKLILFADDLERGTLVHFPNLSQYRLENNVLVKKNYFKTAVLNMRDSFLQRFQEFRNDKATLAFITNLLNANVKELNFSIFDIDTANFEIQLLDLT